MQTVLQREGVRRRLAELVRQQYERLDSRTVATLSVKARVHYTCLARYLLYPEGKRTVSLRRRTLEAVAVALDTNPRWLVDGQGPRQLGLWPILLPNEAEGVVAGPREQVESVLAQLSQLPEPVQLSAYRAAVAAMLDAVTGEGESLGSEAYRCLMRLDALRRSPARRAAS